MSEMSDMHKLIMAMELAKTARVGISLTYFDIIELLGELESLKDYIAGLEALLGGNDPFEEFPKREGNSDCSVLVLGRFEWEEEEQPYTAWEFCRYWFDTEQWVASSEFMSADDLVAWYSLPEECEE